MIKICEFCTNSFKANPKKKNQRFCSHDCYAQSMVNRIAKTCETCGKSFNAKPSEKDSRFCSRSCADQSKITRITKDCEFCGKPFEVIQSFKDRHFCSRTCYAQSKITQVERICETCGKTFKTIQNRKDARFCSWTCHTAKIEFTCAYCGKPFYDKRSKNLRITCSRHCAALLKGKEERGPRKGQVKSEAELQKISETLKKHHKENPTKHPWYKDGAYANGKFRRGPSWNQQRIVARKRDNHTCQNCGKTEAQLGKKLSVHHITPYRLFASSEEANALENLISLCQSCHMKLEHSKNKLPLA